jgi:predicted nucleic acid-binding protein
MYVLDADVLIAALDRNDAHHPQARRLFTAWRAQQDATLVSLVNLSEALVAPAADEAQLRIARAAIAALGVSIHRPTAGAAAEAARLRGRHRISLPDSYLLATAKQIGAAVVSFDANVLRAAKAESLTATP